MLPPPAGPAGVWSVEQVFSNQKRGDISHCPCLQNFESHPAYTPFFTALEINQMPWS